MFKLDPPISAVLTLLAHKVGLFSFPLHIPTHILTQVLHLQQSIPLLCVLLLPY